MQTRARPLRRCGGPLVAGILLAATPGPALAVTLSGPVTQIVDGDTIKVRARGFETTVRLLGVDTPETRDPIRGVQCWGPEASAAMKRLTPLGRRVVLVTDPTQATRDRYGRLLAYVYPPGRRSATRSFNYRLVAGGHARVYIYRGVAFQHLRAFREGQRLARFLERGLWGSPCRGRRTLPPGTTQTAPTTQPDPPAPPPPTPPPAATTPTVPTTPRSGCDPAYPTVCLPASPPDLDCPQITARNFTVLAPDPHRFDVDGDGIGCEN